MRLTVPACRRRLDDDRLAGVDHGGVAAGEAFHAAAPAPRPVLTDLAILAASKAERPHAAVAGQDGAFHFFQKPDDANDAIAGVPAPAPARTFADMKVLEQDRIAEFQDFRIGQPGVVMWVCTASVPGNPGPAGEPEQIVS